MLFVKYEKKFFFVPNRETVKSLGKEANTLFVV